jgi:hypothetical protein
VPKRIYDFIAANGLNVINLWLGSLDVVLRARMRAKIDVLLAAEGGLPPKMLTDTNEPQIKELRVNSKQALRLLLCKGPDPKMKSEEFTLLFGATERDSKYVPRNALSIAETNRQLVIGNPIIHRVLRKENVDSR